MTGSQLAEHPAASAFGARPPTTASHAGRWTASVVAVLLICVFGVIARVIVAHQSLFADELSTYWIVAKHGLGGVMSLLYGNAKIQHAEISPPLPFVLSWLTSQISHAPEAIRAPSLIAGTLTLPIVYLLGLHTVRRRAALLATALTALSPFMIYYSAEARSYAVMMLLATSSTLALLVAIDDRRTRWWVAYAACSCGAFYAHYTCAFLLFAQFLWLVWAHPEARRPALIANLAAIAGVLPWTSGLINDFRSPTTNILSALSPFTVSDVRLSLEHWAIGFPYVEGGGLRALPGTPALILLGLAAVVTTIGIASGIRRSGRAVRLAETFERRTALIFILALSVPVGEAIASAVSSHIFGVRNLAASWPPLALACSALLIGAGPRLRVAAVGLSVVAFGLGAANMLTERFARPDFGAVGAFIDRQAGPRDVVIDGTGVLSPGPLTGLDLTLRRKIAVFRAQAPAEHDHPFSIFDAFIPLNTAVGQAVAAAGPGRVFVVGYTGTRLVQPTPRRFPSRYSLVETRRYPQFVGLTVEVWSGRSATAK